MVSRRHCLSRSLFALLAWTTGGIVAFIASHDHDPKRIHVVNGWVLTGKDVKELRKHVG